MKCRPNLPAFRRFALTVLTTGIAVGGALMGIGSSAFGQSAPPQAQAARAPQALPDLPGAAAASASASATTGPRVRPPPRPRSLSEAANSATAPGDLRPERPVTPQIRIPLGKTPPPPSKAEAAVVERGRPAAVGGVDEAAARCEALDDTRERADCRARARKAAGSTLPR